jgi:hypothetical protein
MLACGLLAGLAAAPAHAAAPVARIVVQSGESPLIAIHAAQSQTRAATLRAQWLARGHTLAQAAQSGEPAITGGTVTAATLAVGDPQAYPNITVSYTAGAAGYNSTEFTFVSSSGQSFYNAGTSVPYFTQSGTISFASIVPLALWSQPGKWRLAGATVYDNAGNSTIYTEHQLAKLFTNRSYTVTNSGLWDGRAPKILSGKLRNDTVSLSATYPALKAVITASDAGSGIYVAYVFIQPPGQTYYEAAIIPNAVPVRHGAIKAFDPLNEYDPTGTWGIIGYAVCDVASNCAGSTNQSDVLALFGTDSFTVTP